MTRPIPDENSLVQLDDIYYPEKIELVELLMFPITKKNQYRFSKINWALFHIWKNICNKYMIDHEYRYIYFDYFHSYESQEPWEDEIDEVKRARTNAETWIEKAKQEMLDFCAPLYSLIVDRNDYPKHYPRFGESKESIKNRSRNNDAILLPEYTNALQNFLFTKVVEYGFPIILTKINSVFIIERKKLTGYSEGFECTKLVCKINSTSKLVHLYPIHDNELYKYQKIYPNPILTNHIFGIDEDDENEHLKEKEIKNLIEID
ncbi:hypothetical protein [Maribellus maritimus]|uniref:hypothetical protein n=1 Tax=Maribellus maritimus TaxID=2870838 RepID=UPI001EEAB4C6|nr:hypothetical protein [Maribellus maritimus]MCG6189106.1 hypothetical protein [Maribellus maritimus]